MGQTTWVVVQADTAQKLLVLAPGETSQEGNVASGGKLTGPNASFTVGTTYFVEVRAVDSYFNIVTTTNPVITLTSNDTNVVSPSTDSGGSLPRSMVAGSKPARCGPRSLT